MTTAVDTNVCLDLLGPDATRAHTAREALARAVEEGQLALSVVVYAELTPRFQSRAALDRFLSGLGAEPTDLSREAAYLAGQLFQSYRARGGKRERVIADFLVAAHAITTADRLLTSDRGFSSELFHPLKVVSPDQLR